MAKHEIEMPDDAIPDGWKLTGEYRQVNCYDDYMTLPGSVAEWLGDEPSDEAYLILRKVEPVRESRWGWICCVNTSLDEALANSRNYSGPLVRADYEDGKCVFVGIENARPLTASIEEA